MGEVFLGAKYPSTGPAPVVNVNLGPVGVLARELFGDVDAVFKAPPPPPPPLASGLLVRPFIMR